MTAASGSLPESPAPFEGFEVGTVSADALRARIQVRGTLDPAASALLLSVVRSHVTAGRRYVRVDLAEARIASPAVTDALAEATRTIDALGGMLVIENARAGVAAIDPSSFLRSAD